MPSILQADSWATLLGYIDTKKLDGEWLVVEAEDGRKREGYAHVGPDGSIVLSDDEGNSYIFDRDDIDTVAI